MAVAVAVAAQRQWRQLGCSGKLGSSGGSFVAVWPQRQQPGGNTAAVAAAAAAAAQLQQWQFCSGRQLGGGGGSLAAAAWRQHGHCGRLLLVDYCLCLPPPSLLPPVSLLPPGWRTYYTLECGKTGFMILCCYQT
jgi:hypothetical protein